MRTETEDAHPCMPQRVYAEGRLTWLCSRLTYPPYSTTLCARILSATLLLLCAAMPVVAGSFFDNHSVSPLNGWDTVGSRGWSESNGFAEPDDNDATAALLINEYACKNNGTFTATIKTSGSSTSRHGGVVFRFTNASNYYYLAMYIQTLSGHTEQNEVRVFKNTVNWDSQNPVGSFENLNYKGNATQTVKIELDGSQFSIFLDDSLLGVITDATHSSGRVGYGHDEQGGVYVSFDQSSWEDATVDYTWDNSTSAGIQEGNGTWGVDSYWSETVGDGTALLAWPDDDASATFTGSGGPYTIVVDGTQNVDSLSFLSGQYELTTGTIDLGSFNGVQVDVPTTISAAIDGSSGLKKYGNGQMRLAGNNVYTGATYLYDGETVLLHANALGNTDSATTVSSGACATISGTTTYASEQLNINGTGMDFPGALRTPMDAESDTPIWPGTITLQGNSSIGASDSYDQITISGAVTGSHQLTTDGDGTILLSGTNTFSGDLVIANGILMAGSASALGNTSNDITISTGAALDINGQELDDYTQGITINGQVDASTGALINTGADQLRAIRQIALGSDASIGNDGGRFDIGRDNTGMRITGNSHTLTKVGSNQVAFMAEATGLAELVIDDGTVSLEHSNAAGSAPITVNSGGTLSSNGAVTFSNDITMNSATLSSSSNQAYDPAYSGIFTISGTNTIHNNHDNSITISGAVGGTGSVTKTGAGELELCGTNTYTGATTVSAGTLKVNGSTASESAVTVAATLAGTGTVAGSVDARGGTIVPGDGGAGTLSTGSLTLDNTSMLDFELGASSRDSIEVSGDLALDGTLDVTGLSGFGQGTYTLMTCTGTITDNGLEIGTAPASCTYEISVTANTVELVATEIDVAPTDISLFSDQVAEEQPVNTVVGELSTTDANTNESFTYTLVPGTGSTDNASFNINGNQLRTSEEFDHSMKSSYSVRVRTTDKAALTYEKIFTITVLPLGRGLTGQYYSGMNFNTFVMNRIDTVVSFDWEEDSPDTGLNNDSYSVRWRGQVRPQHTETYTFYTYTDDGARLWVDGVQVVTGAWKDQDLTEHSGTISLTKGELYDITFEYYQNWGQAVAELRWSSPSLSKEVIPSNNLYPIYPPHDITLSNAWLKEEEPSGTTVGTFTALDSTENDSHTWSLVSGTGSTDNNSFSIDGDVLKTASVLDYEEKATYSIRVRATDSEGLFFEKIFTIWLEDIMEGTIVRIDADTVEDQGENLYNSLDVVMGRINSGQLSPDYVLFIGEDQDTYTMTQSCDRDLGKKITFIGESTDPDMFPIINRSEPIEYYDFFGRNDVYFERLIFTGEHEFKPQNNTSTTLSFANCVVRDFSNSVGFINLENGSGKPIIFTNCLFEGNTTVFSINFWGTDPELTITNCTFDNNSTVFANDPGINDLERTSIKNCVFTNNSTTFSGANLKAKTSYSLTSESISGYGTNCEQGDPDYVSSTRDIPSDWGIFATSPASDMGSTVGAPAKDISGYFRKDNPDAGCWEVQTADYTWDVSTNAGIDVGDGTWGTDDYWTLTDGDGTVLQAWPGEGNTATFAGEDGAYSITVNGIQNADSLSFLRTGYTLSGGEITLSDNASVYVSSQKNATISTAISGSSGFNLYGDGHLTVDGANTFSGAVTLSGGILETGSSAALGNSANAITVSSGAVMDINGQNLQNYTENIVINGQFDDSTGALINTGAEQQYAIRQIALGSDAAIGSNDDRFDIGRDYTGVRITGNNHTLTKVGTNYIGFVAEANDLAELIVDEGIVSLENANAAGTAPITINSGGNLTAWGDLTFSNAITLNDGATISSNWWADGYTFTYNGSVSVNGSATLNSDGTNVLFFGGIIGGTGSIHKTGGATVIVSGSNTYTGATTISEGTLVVNGSTDASSTVSVQSGATLGGTGNVGGAVEIADSGHIAPGHIGAGTLSTGSLNLNNASELDFELGTQSDRIDVTGDLTLDGVLHIDERAGFDVGTYTLMTYTGTLTDNELSVGPAPLEYVYLISAEEGEVTLTVTHARELLPITVKHNIDAGTSDTCLVYTDDWSIVFDEAQGGQISFLSNQPDGGGTNQVYGSNQRNLFSIQFQDASYVETGVLQMVETTPFYAIVRNTYTLNNITFTEEYTVYGSGRAYVTVTADNHSGSNQTAQLSFLTFRHDVGSPLRKAAEQNAWECPYVLNAESNDSQQFDILLAVYDLWRDATTFTDDDVLGYSCIGYTDDSYTLGQGVRESWDFLIDFGGKTYNATSELTHDIVADYRTPDSLAFIAGSRGMEKAWEYELQAHWTFDDESGNTARDHSGANRHAVVTGSFTDGIWNGALSLNGSQNATCPDHEDFGGTYHMAVMGWVKAASFDGNAVVAGKHNGSAGWKLTGNGSGQLSLHLDGDVLSSNTSIDDNQWHHVAASYSVETDEVELFVDGKLDAVFTGEYAAHANSSDLVMGDGLSGLLDDVRYYSKPVSDHTLKSIYQIGYRSSNGWYHTRADNNNTMHLLVDGSNPRRHFPTFRIDNYWASSKPAPGCVVLDGVTLSEGSDYHAVFDNERHTLTIGLNKILRREDVQLYIDDDNTENHQRVGETPKMSWGVDQLGSTDYVWVKNFAGNTFGDDTSNQWYVNWNMSTAGSAQPARDGEIWYMASSVEHPHLEIDTSSSNLIPGSEDEAYYCTMGSYDLWQNDVQLRSSQSVQNEFTYTVLESSTVRFVMRVNERQISADGQNYRLITQWTVYPTGQIFRYDSVYQ
ncbi:MAG: PA14 domain-containing protein, partial [Chitinivibrionales bacterium]